MSFASTCVEALNGYRSVGAGWRNSAKLISFPPHKAKCMHKTKSGIELLKVIFEHRKEGAWGISALSSLAIKPKDTSKDFFPIADEMVMFQPSSFGPTTFFLGQSIVPIVAQVHGESVLRCIGTGFFVSCTGLLITAAHVVSDPIERQYGGITESNDLLWHAREMKLGVMIPLNPMIHGKAYLFREIEWASFLAEKADNPLPIQGINLRLTSDVAICKVASLAPEIPYQPLTIVQSGLLGTGMSVGKTATAIGYGAMRDVPLGAAENNQVIGDFPFDLHASTGNILERFPDNAISREVPTPGACFSASLSLPGGMSGSPIFDHEGIYVHGVVSKGWVDETGVSNLGFGSMLADSMRIPIRQMDNKSLFQLHAESEHGFAKLSGPDL